MLPYVIALEASLLITGSMSFLHNCVPKQELGNKNDGFAKIWECSRRPEPFTYVMLSGVEASFTAQDKLRRREYHPERSRRVVFPIKNLFDISKTGCI